jgi:8-oxo-dGTP pyrophosphatase MutT (NUDIX family)
VTPQQAGVIAVRRRGGDVEMCLIRRKESRGWGIPKGMVERGDTHEETALNEAWEEAGLKGRLVGDAVGTYEYEKWDACLVVAVYVMTVLEELDDWEEAHFRERTWAPLGEAAAMLADHPVFPLLQRVRPRLEGPQRRVAR